MKDLFTDRLYLRLRTPRRMAECRTKDWDELSAFFGTDSKEYLQKQLDIIELGAENYSIRFCYWDILIRDTETCIGNIGFFEWYFRHFKAELGYWMHEEVNRNKGYISEALTEVLEFGFNDLNMHRIYARTALDNEPSKAVLKKFGFTEEGISRQEYFSNNEFTDSLNFALLKSEYKPR
ncbi:MAG: GNAT family N-acetyltransferase [Bacteroidetes bacterium]|nr:GNAT family N-acetyltransferase [Bacteroidota bacterium]